MLATVVIHAGTAFELVPAAMLVLVLPGYAVCAAVVPEQSLKAIGTSLGQLKTHVPADMLKVTASNGEQAPSFALQDQSSGFSGQLSGTTNTDDVTYVLAGTSVAMLAVAVLVAGGALYFSGQPPAELATQGYTVLWAVPDSAAASTIHLGVQNGETSSREYLMRASWGDQLLREWSVQLGATGVWQTDLDISGDAQTSGDLRVLLYSADDSNTPLRQAVIRGSSLAQQAPAATPTSMRAVGMLARVTQETTVSL